MNQVLIQIMQDDMLLTTPSFFFSSTAFVSWSRLAEMILDLHLRTWELLQLVIDRQGILVYWR